MRNKIRSLIVASAIAATGVIGIGAGNAAALTGCGPAHVGSPPSFTWAVCTGWSSGLMRAKQKCVEAGGVNYWMYGPWVASPNIASSTGNCPGSVTIRSLEVTF